jgi:hypothetical protein
MSRISLRCLNFRLPSRVFLSCHRFVPDFVFLARSMRIYAQLTAQSGMLTGVYFLRSLKKLKFEVPVQASIFSILDFPNC